MICSKMCCHFGSEGGWKGCALGDYGVENRYINHWSGLELTGSLELSWDMFANFYSLRGR